VAVSPPPPPPPAPPPTVPANPPPTPAAAPTTPRTDPTPEPPPNLLASDYGLRPETPEADPWSPVRRWGVYILVLGLGSLVLPLFGHQFKLMSVFGDSPWMAGIVLSLIGAFLVAWTYWDRE
jgi:hypothetical protein